MAKRIKNPISMVITQSDDVVSCRLDYGLECDDGMEVRRSCEPELTSGELDHAISDLAWALNRIKVCEGIA